MSASLQLARFRISTISASARVTKQQIYVMAIAAVLFCGYYNYTIIDKNC